MPSEPKTTDLTDACLRVFHGDGPHGWNLLKQQWPDAAVSEQRRKMGDVIAKAQDEAAREVRRLSGCLLAIAGADGCGNGALRAAAYEAATMGETPGNLASKLGLPSPLKGSAENV